MNAHLIESLSPAQLSQLLRLDDAPWSDQDAAGILRHQLQAPLLEDLALVPSIALEIKWLEECIRKRRAAAHSTFLDELTGPVPVLELLVAIKRFARAMREDSASPLYGSPATVLYFAAVAVALARCGTRITRLSDVELREGFAWALKQGGAERLSGAFRDALNCLRDGGTFTADDS